MAKEIEEKTKKEVKTKQEVKTKKTKSNKASKKKDPFMKSVASEMKKVVFPSFKEIMKYTAATIIMCIVLVAFFLLLNYGLHLIKGWF